MGFSRVVYRNHDEVCFFNGDFEITNNNFFCPSFLFESGFATAGSDCYGRLNFVFSGSNFVLKRYKNQGIRRYIFNDVFFSREIKNVKSFREFEMLSALVEMRLPVPLPIAARMIKFGPLYRAEIITDCLRGGRSLAKLLSVERPSQNLLFQIGRTIATMHGAGVFNPRIGADTIQLDDDEQIQLTDFEFATLRNDGQWCRANLDSFRRSLERNYSRCHSWTWNKHDWDPINDGYRLSFA